MEDKVNLEADYYLNLKQLAKLCAVSEGTLRVILDRPELAKYTVVRREDYVTTTGVVRKHRKLAYAFNEDFRKNLINYFTLRREYGVVKLIEKASGKDNK